MRSTAVPVTGRILTTAVLSLLFASAPAAPTITVGSKGFTENRLLGEIMAQLIEERMDVEVVRKDNLSGSMITFSALLQGEIDLYPEYTGTLWYSPSILNLKRPPLSALEAYALPRQQLAENWDLHLLVPFGFNNTYAMAVRAQTAERLNLKSISDLVPHVDQLQIALSHEFLQRVDGWPRLAQHYGFPPTEPRGIEHGLIYHALMAGEADLADSYSTDGKLVDYPVRTLEDDLGFFPPYQGVPLVAGRTLKAWPALGPLLSELGFRFDDEKMRNLNNAVEKSGDYAGVARMFLETEGLLESKSTSDEPETESANDAAFWQGIQAQTIRHLMLSLVSALLATLIALPLGILLSRYPAYATAVIWITGMLQTIPALALFAFLITLPGFGLGTMSAIFAISLYAVLPVLRNVCTGIREVDSSLTDTARALGLSARDILLRVELPLASPTIMAGIRTAAVIAVGMATLAAFVGAGGLGDSILTGMQLVNTPLILAGALPAALLALLTDASLALVERWVKPTGLRI